MQTCDQSPPNLATWVKRRAMAEGFDAAGIASPAAIETSEPRLHAFLEAGFHGEMAWLAANADRRASPRVLCNARHELRAAQQSPGRH